MEEKKYYKDIIEGIGNTPLIKLNRIAKGFKANIFAKLEFLNPMGSVKDRIAKFMIEKAEKEGRIKPDYTIVDNSSGNTALALAMVCAIKGYKLKIVVRDSLSSEKIKFLRAMNVELVIVDHTLPPESPNSYNNIVPRIAQDTPNGYYLDQHNNRENNETHYQTTGPEIWEQMEGKIDYFIAGVGTGGTICGAAKFLKEKDHRIKVIGVDPVGSIFYDYFHSKKLIEPSPYLLEGLGDEFLIDCVDFNLIDDFYQVTDKDAFLMTRKLANKEAILAGGSSGAAIWAALKLAKEIDRPARIVTIFADSANRYLSTIYNDEWLEKKGIL
ncbi:MAG: cysteine synthase family protein [Candidatus Aminicenantes bacterium]|nr:cysteine synthase family protein [Candidatus Aminicenantes bacterium]MBL7082041.1 cysteine synthase family protein [Candidatus Aminicenantes bacterium]